MCQGRTLNGASCVADTFYRRPAGYALPVPVFVATQLDSLQLREAVSMDRKKISSDKIRGVGYDASNQLLELEFSDGRVVQYSRVPPEVHRRLMAAPTIVSYFRDNIEDEYTARRIR